MSCLKTVPPWACAGSGPHASRARGHRIGPAHRGVYPGAVRWFTSLLVVLVALVCCRGRSSGPSPAPSGSGLGGLSPELLAQPLARVGERTITLGDYVAVLERMDRFERLRYQSPERRRKLLDEIIKVELLAAEARRRGLDRRPEIAQRVREALRDELLVRLRRSVPGPDQIPESEVRAYYDQHRAEFRVPERRRVAQIVVRDRALARQVLAQARAATPAQWGQLVRRYSIQPSDDTEAPELAGDLGLVSAPGEPSGANPRVPEPVRKAVFEIPALGGVYEQVVEADGNFHIVRLTGKSEAGQRSLLEAERSIRIVLAEQRLRKAEQQLEAELRRKYPVVIDQAALGALEVPPPGSSPGAAQPRTRTTSSLH